MTFSDNVIDDLKEYSVAIKNIAHEFYDDRFQPNTAIKEKESGFWDLDYPISLEAYSSIIDDDEVFSLLRENGYKKYTSPAYSASASTACVGILEDEKGDWSFMRLWKQNGEEARRGRSFNPLVLQPLKTIPMANGYPIEILPYVPIVDIKNKHGGRVSFMEAIAVEKHLTRQFENLRINIERGTGLNDMGVLPNGQIVFADPGHCHLRHNVTDRMLQEQFASFQNELDGHDDIRQLFDYVDLASGQWSQDKFFPKLKA